MISDEGRKNIQEAHKKRSKESRQENDARMDRLIALAQADPQAFQQLVQKVMGKMLVPHSEGQKEVLTAEERFLVLCAGRRWGKSQIGAAKALRTARKPRQIIWWIAPTYKVVKRGYEAVVKQCPDELLQKPAPPSSGFDAGRAIRLYFKNGSIMEFYSAERPEGMLGGSCDFMILDEAATMPEHVWTQIVRATLADRKGKALFISTPRGKNWFYRMWMNGQDPQQPEYRSWRFPSRTNPTIDPAEFDGMEAELPLAVYEQEILAEFISNAASVFRFPKGRDPDTGEESNDFRSPVIVELQPPQGHVILGIDLAKHNDFSVLFGVRASDRQPCWHDRFNQVSWPKQRALINEAVDEILRTADGVTLVVDSTGVGDVIYDDLAEAGYDVVGIKFSPQWKTSAVQLLSADLERGHAFIIEDMLPEFESYSYSISDSGRWKYEAATGHDDEVSAALLAHWGVVHSGVPNIQTLHGGGDSIVGESSGGFLVWEDEVDIIDDGVARTRTVAVPTIADLMNNPNAWG
jgi:hypothetical protein